MTSITEVCNIALLEIGEEPITSIDSPQKNATRCKLIFDKVVDEVSASRYWSKLKSRVELALLPDPPVYEYTFQFQLPSDTLHVVSINDIAVGFIPDEHIDRLKYQIEGDKLLIDTNSVFIKYIKRQSNPQLWGIYLERAIVLRLAAGLSYIITGDATITEKKFLQYERYSRASTATDSNQGSASAIRSYRLLRVR